MPDRGTAAMIPESVQPAAMQLAQSSNPWATEGSGPDAGTTEGGSTDWLDAAAAPPEATPIDWLHPFQEALIPLDVWVDQGLDWVVDNFRPVFQAIRWPIDTVLTGFETALGDAPAILTIVIDPPRTADRLTDAGYDVVVLSTKLAALVDGGLSCLSLRYSRAG